MYLKCAFSMLGAIGLIIASETSHYKNEKYIACLSFGYICYRFWGEKKPTKMIADCWFFIQPFLFGTIGAALHFTQVSPKVVGSSFILIFSGQFFRFIGAFISSSQKKHTIKERLFMAMSWIPKSTVPATLGTMIYTESLPMGPKYAELQNYGLQI